MPFFFNEIFKDFQFKWKKQFFIIIKSKKN